MNIPDTPQSPVRKAGKSLSLILASLLYLVLLLAAANIFYASDRLIFGPEQIVGALNVGYHDDGRFYYTSPVAILFRCVLYLIFSAAVTWLAAAGCGTLLHLSHRSAGFTKMRRLLLACAFAGILIGIGVGILSWMSRRDAELWQSVRAFRSLAQYESRFGKAKQHAPEVNEANVKQFRQNSRMCSREFALGKEVYVFSSAWPFRRFFVWLENGRIVKTTWCGGW